MLQLKTDLQSLGFKDDHILSAIKNGYKTKRQCMIHMTFLIELDLENYKNGSSDTKNDENYKIENDRKNGEDFYSFGTFNKNNQNKDDFISKFVKEKSKLKNQNKTEKINFNERISFTKEKTVLSKDFCSENKKNQSMNEENKSVNESVKSISSANLKDHLKSVKMNGKLIRWKKKLDFRNDLIRTLKGERKHEGIDIEKIIKENRIKINEIASFKFNSNDPGAKLYEMLRFVCKISFVKISDESKYKISNEINIWDYKQLSQTLIKAILHNKKMYIEIISKLEIESKNSMSKGTNQDVYDIRRICEECEIDEIFSDLTFEA